MAASISVNHPSAAKQGAMQAATTIGRICLIIATINIEGSDTRRQSPVQSFLENIQNGASYPVKMTDGPNTAIKRHPSLFSGTASEQSNAIPFRRISCFQDNAGPQPQAISLIFRKKESGGMPHRIPQQKPAAAQALRGSLPEREKKTITCPASSEPRQPGP
ncbi:hypothetical protein [Akkermansia sp.]|uniref:hypothetical protein n=1 Tax=Akkermansia sp. TaxID=1872421 RepID=UPI003AB4EC71